MRGLATSAALRLALVASANAGMVLNSSDDCPRRAARNGTRGRGPAFSRARPRTIVRALPERDRRSSDWTFREGTCYLRTSTEHSFDECNRFVCPALANVSSAYGDDVTVSHGGGVHHHHHHSSVLACVTGRSLNTFLAGRLGGGDGSTWVGLYQRRKDGADPGR